MALADHVEGLKVKHAEYEAAIEEEYSRPHPDEIILHDLKRHKLRIKDELVRISSQ